MKQQIPRRSFFPALALSPLAWLGVRKTELVPYPISNRKVTEEEINNVRRWFSLVKKNGKEFDRALAAEKALKEAQAVINEACCLLEASRPCNSTYQADALMVLRAQKSSRITKRKTA